ncbi:MAG: MFS transporter, partial [Pseudomonadota bacterium]
MKAPVLFIMLTVMLDAMGIGLIVPVMPDLLRDINGGGLSEAAVWGGVLATSFAVMQFLFGPVLGGLSDRFGRRPILLLSLAVMAADYVVMALTHSIWLLLAARIIGGITAATQSTASAYMADISTGAERTKNFGLIGAAFGMGFVLGPVIGGLLAELGPRAPFWAAAGLSIANMILGYLVLKETVSRENARAFDWRRANPFGSFRQLGKLPGVRRLVLVYFLYHFAFTVYPSVWAYFGQARFDWTPAIIGASLASFGLAMAAVQGGLVRLILNRLGERGTATLSFVFGVLTYVCIGLIPSGSIILTLTPIAALGAMAP